MLEKWLKFHRSFEKDFTFWEKNVFESREALCRCCGNIHTTYAKRQIDRKTDRQKEKRLEYKQKDRQRDLQTDIGYRQRDLQADICE
jgi:hypothetical protein